MGSAIGTVVRSSSLFQYSTTLLRSVLLAGVLFGSSVNTPTAFAGSYDSINRQPGATCQIAAGIIVEDAVSTISKLKFVNFFNGVLNPASSLTKKEAKKRNKGLSALQALLVAVAVAQAVTCPPIVMQAPFRELNESQRRNIVLGGGLDPMDPDLLIDVEKPSDRNSCSVTLNQVVNLDNGRIMSFGDFPEMEFVYAEPFGSFPSLTDFFGKILAARIQAIMDEILSLLPGDIKPDLSFNSPADFADDVGDLPSPPSADLGKKIPGVGSVLDSVFNFKVVSFEDTMNAFFNGWDSDMIHLSDVRIKRIEQQIIFGIGVDVGYEFEFHDGLTEFAVVADNASSPYPGHLKFRYTQRVFVNENFKPDFDVLYEIEDPENPGTMLKIVADGEYEALEPGRADRGYTPPTSFQGSLGAFDNCDPDPKEFIHIPQELKLGIHYFPITAIDRANNESDLFYVRINVVDSIPPDVNPPESIGIEVAPGTTVVNFTDPGIGCTAYLCQNNLLDRQIYPPTYFDFATITPAYDCFASNTLGMDQTCDGATLPVGEATEIRWLAVDPSGNTETIIQHVAVRETGTNMPPTAEGTSVTVASGITTAIPLLASDPEFDPLTWQVNSIPVNGQLEATPEASFQTRFSLTGTMDNMSSIVKLDGSANASDTWNRVLIADEGNHRLLEVDSRGMATEPDVYFTHFLGDIKPASILLYDFDNSEGNIQNEPYLDELLIADWSTGRIHTLLGPNHSPDAGYDISQWVSNPEQIALQKNGSNARLFVTEPSTVDNSKGRLVVLNISDFDPATTADTWLISHEATINLHDDLAGFNAGGITATDCGLLLLSDTDATGTGQNARMASYYYADSLDHSFDRIWDISSLTQDPPGDARPLLGAQVELAGVLGGDCASYDVYVADDASKEIIPLHLDAGGSLQDDPALRAGTEFITILNIEAPLQDKFFVMTESRLARYDINGLLDALLLISDSTNNFHNFNQLFPQGDMWIDMDLAPNGDLVMLDYGSPGSGSATYPALARVRVNAGFNQFSRHGDGIAQVLEKAWALTFNPGPTAALADDRVLFAGSEGLESLDANSFASGSSQLLLSHFEACDWCGASGFTDSSWEDILDVESDATGNVYFSDSLNRVHKFSSAGSYIGWLGRCDSGADCDVANGHSDGFSCLDSSCNVSTTAGKDTGQFDFEAHNNSNQISFRRPRYGRLMVDEQAGLLYVSDYPDYDNSAATPRLPRIQSFSLVTGAFNSETIPDGQPGNLLSFLEPGDFTDINDMAVFGDTFYVAEDLPLERLHVFDVNAFSANLNGSFVNYISNPGFEGADLFDYSVKDSFGSASNLAQVDIEVVIDDEAPSLVCPADINIEGTHPGGARVSNFVQAEAGSVALAEFLEAYTLTDNVTTPAATASHDAPVLFPLGDTLVTFTAKDGVGNESACSATVSVVDTVPPELVQPADARYEATAKLSVINLPQPAASDQVGPVAVSVSPSGPYPLGVTELIWSATDGHGNQTRVSQTLVVTDTVAPLFGSLPPLPDQEAVNGWGNVLNYAVPAAFDVVGLNNPVGCMPAPDLLVASVPVDIYCQALDTSTNLARLQFQITVVQSDDDADGISNIVDPTPANADNSGLYSDIPLGGTTFGRIIDASGYKVSVVDAWHESQGVRIEVSPLVLSQTNRFGPQGKQQGVPEGAPVELSACDGKLHISGLTDGLDADGDSGPGTAVIACDPYLVIAESGSLSLTLPAPNNQTAEVELSNGNGISFDGVYYIAPDSNTGPIIISTVDGIISVEPGKAMVAAQPRNIPTISLLGILSMLLLLAAVAQRELRRRH